MIAAYQAGSDMIEFDIYMTTDREVVVMHDGTVDRTTNGTGAIEGMTLAQVKNLTIKNSDGLKVPTLKEVYQEFQGKDIILFIEIKSSKPEILQLVKTLTQQYNVEDQIVFHSFSVPQLRTAREVYPEISCGNFIQTAPSGGDLAVKLQAIFHILSPINASYNPSVTAAATAFDADFVRAANHRGLLISAWTANAQAVFEGYYKTGCHAILTDYANLASDYVTDLRVNTYQADILPRESVALFAEPVTQSGGAAAGEAVLVKLDGNVTLHGGRPDGEGKAVYAYKYTQSYGGDAYDVYSQPIEINVLKRLLSYHVAGNENPFADGKFDAEVTLVNLSNRAKTPFVIIAVYAPIHELAYVEITPLPEGIAPYGTVTLPKSLAVPEHARKLLVTIVDDDGITPLVTAHTIVK
jgi:glycerophosphoryl diester phosphodiesterase